MSGLVNKSESYDFSDICCALTGKLIKDGVILSGDGESN